MTAILTALAAKALPYVALVFAIIAGALGWRRSIRREVKRETALEAAERYAKTRKAMDDEDARIPDDPGVLRDWLQHRDPGTK